MAQLDVDAARASARGAALPLYNPELTGHVGPQFGAGTPQLQFEVGLAQTIERGGKRGARTKLADAQTRVSDIGRRGELLRARVEAWNAFERALVMRDRVETRKQVEQLALALVTAMQKTAQAGGTTKLRVNVAVAEAGRATQERLAAEAEYATARATLATAIGAAPNEQLDPTGAVPELSVLANVDELVQRTLREHPDALATEQNIAVARARIADADARGKTDFTVGVAYGYDPDPDGAHTVVGSIAWPLGIRNRNQGERAAARVGAKRAEVEQTYTRSEIERAVRLAAANYERARAGIAAFNVEVNERLGDNLSAAQDAFAKGGMDFVELTTTQRDLIASRISFLDARLALVDAWASLALASGMEVKP